MVHKMIFSHPESTPDKYLFEPAVTNAELLDCVVDAIAESGGRVTYLAPQDYFPFRLQIDGKANIFNVQIYIWQLTKRTRRKSEFQFQVIGIDRFTPTPGEKTLVLGWWEEAGVFAGFDVRRHLRQLGSSHSFRVHEDVLRKAYLNEFYPYYKENRGVVIAFSPALFVYYVSNLESLHNFGRSAQDLAVPRNITQVSEINDASINIQDLERKKTFVSLSKALRNISFRKRVLNVYGYRCAFCGSFNSVEVAHIIPVSHENSTDETCNGLALCALHHKAYDQALIAVAEDYSVILNRPQAEKLRKIKLDRGLAKFAKDLRQIILLPPAVSDRPHAEYIKIANSIRGLR